MQRARAFYALTKPRVVSLIVFTAVIGMFLAAPGMVEPRVLLAGTFGIALVAGAAAALVLGGLFMAYAVRIHLAYSGPLARRTFRYSILYLAALFAALLVDHHLPN